MQDLKGDLIIVNGQWVRFNDLSSDIFTNQDHQIYEVIRVINGIPIFLSDHMDRMKSSLQLMGVKENRIQAIPIHDDIIHFIEGMKDGNFNIKVLINLNNQEFIQRIVYESKSYYPEESTYQQGVSVCLYATERQNPNAKVYHTDYKKRVSDLLQEKEAFEALLVNSDNLITEGSRSNLFFVMEGIVYTAPGDMILMGITRRYVLQACKDKGIKVKEIAISPNLLNKVDAVFLSGTSIKVLPINKIDEIEYKSVKNPIVQAIMEGFDAILIEYMKKRKKNMK